MFYYFGFGPNLSTRSLETLGCAPITSEPAILHDVELRFDVPPPLNQESGQANIHSCVGKSVHGVLHTLRDDDLRVLSRAERDGIDFKRIERSVVTYRGRRVHAFLFVGRHRSQHELRPLHLDLLLAGAQQMGLEPGYIEELETRYSRKAPRAEHPREIAGADSGPATRAIFEAEEKNNACGHENFGFLSFEAGLMPRTPPSDSLGTYHLPWDEIARELPSLYRSQQLRSELGELPLLKADAAHLSDRHLLRACSVLAMLSHAYWYVEPRPPLALPTSLAEPWEQVRTRLERGPEVLNYIDLIVYNWRLIDPEVRDPLRVENLRLMIPTVNNREERVFYLTQVEILARASPAIGAMALAQQAVLMDDAEALTAHLSVIHAALSRIVYDSLLKINPNPRSQTHVDPVLWAKSVAPFAVPFHPHVQGPSGTSSPIFNCLDIFFGRKTYESFLGREIKNLRVTYPPAWQNFLLKLSEVSIPKYVDKKQNDTLSGAFREVFQLYAGDSGFLGRHRMKVYSYLEVAFKVGRSVTIGGFDGMFKDRTWDEVDNELEASRRERTGRFLRETRSARVLSVTPGKRDRSASVQNVILDVRGAGIRYEPGDRCGILPKHHDALVERTLKALGANGTELVVLTDEWKAAMFARNPESKPEILPLREILRFGMIRPVVPRVAEALHAYSQSPLLKTAIAAQKTDHYELWELLEALSAEGFHPPCLWHEQVPSNKFARLVPPERFRMYSISSVMNSAHVEPAKTLELTVGQLSYESHRGAHCRGTASHFLADALEHETELAFFIEHPPRFQLPIDPRVPVLMLAGGTGISPFRSFLRERPWTRSHQAWLFLGLRERESFQYESDVSPALRDGTLQLDVAFSRDDIQLSFDQDDGFSFLPGTRCRIQDRLLAPENAESLGELLRDVSEGGRGAHVYICGRSGFAASIWKALGKLLERHYRSHRDPASQAAETLHRLVADGRLLQELYSDAREAPHSPVLYNVSQIAAHNDEKLGYWMILDGSVYNLTEFIHQHPGGARILKGYAGLDASEGFARAHQGRPEISAMQELYLVGTVRRLEFGSEQAEATSPSGPVMVSPATVYRAWSRALMLVVEMQNALRMDHALQSAPCIEQDSPAMGSAYKLSRSLESHQRFLRSHLDLLLNETLDRLWSVTQPLFGQDEDANWVKRQLQQICTSEEYSWSETLAEELSAAGPKRMPYDRLVEVAELLEREDLRFLSDMKLVLLVGVSVFERFEAETLEKGADALIQALRSSVDVVAGYFSHLVEELHEKRGYRVSGPTSRAPRRPISSIPPRRVMTTHYWFLDEYGGQKLAILRRTPTIVTSLEDLAAQNDLILTSIGERHKDYGLVVDLRQGPVRNDPQFEETMSQLRLGLFDGFARTAVLIESAIGVLQVNRLQRLDHREILATQSESSAIKFAMGDR